MIKNVEVRQESLSFMEILINDPQIHDLHNGLSGQGNGY